MRQPTEGGSYVYDPKKDELTQVEKPTVHLDPNQKSTAPPAEIAEPAIAAEGEPLKKGK
jgi:hypothetical protein